MPVSRKQGRKGPNGEPVWRVRICHEGTRLEHLVPGTRKEAESHEARWKLEVEAAGRAPEQRTAPRFSTFCLERYAVHAVAHLRGSTWSVRRYQLASLVEHLGNLRMTELTTEIVEGYKATRRKVAKPRTVNNELAVLQAVLRYAHELGVPCASPKVKLLPVIGRGRVTFWTVEQLEALYASVETHAPELLPIVVCLVNTGMRKGEAIAMEQAWIDLRRRLIRLEPNDEWQPKDNEPREVPISDALLPWLMRALATQRRYAFPCSTGDRWACWPKRAFDRARKLAGRCAACEAADPDGETGGRCASCMPQLRGGPHTLRHTFASHFLQACPDMFLLAQVLGHSETRTSKIYAHLLPSHLERARNAVSLGPAMGPATHDARRRWGT